MVPYRSLLYIPAMADGRIVAGPASAGRSTDLMSEFHPAWLTFSLACRSTPLFPIYRSRNSSRTASGKTVSCLLAMTTRPVFFPGMRITIERTPSSAPFFSMTRSPRKWYESQPRPTAPFGSLRGPLGPATRLAAWISFTVFGREDLLSVNRAVVQHHPQPLRHVPAGGDHLAGSGEPGLFERYGVDISPVPAMAGDVVLIKVQGLRVGSRPRHAERP